VSAFLAMSEYQEVPEHQQTVSVVSPKVPRAALFKGVNLQAPPPTWEPCSVSSDLFLTGRKLLLPLCSQLAKIEFSRQKDESSSFLWVSQSKKYKIIIFCVKLWIKLF
jgi:hypothetical protein